MSKTITKYLLALCLICNVGNVFAQHRYYCEVKGIEKDLSSGLKIIFDFGTKASYNIWGDLSSKLKFVDENVIFKNVIHHICPIESYQRLSVGQFLYLYQSPKKIRHKKKASFKEMKDALLVGIPGFEPGMTGPESVVLPLHHIPMLFAIG